MKNSKQKKPFLLYTIIIILALVILALGGLTLYSFQDLASLRSKVTDLQNTVQEISDTSAELISQAKELGSLNDQLESSNDSETDSSVDSSQDVQEEGTISPSHSSESSTDESLNSLLSQIKPLLPQNNGTWSVYVCNLMKNTEGVIDDQPMQAASLIKLFIMGTVYENYESLSETYGADTLNSYLNSMITVSDNDAANKLVNMLGDSDDEAGMRAVNAFCASHGYSSTSMGRLLLQSNEYGDNYTSVSDCGHFLKEIYQSNAGTAESTLAHTDAMYSLLKMQQRRNKIPANLPDGVKVANKTGELDDVENDAGIIYNTAKTSIWLSCFMSQDLTDSSEAQAVIAQDFSSDLWLLQRMIIFHSKKPVIPNFRSVQVFLILLAYLPHMTFPRYPQKQQADNLSKDTSAKNIHMDLLCRSHSFRIS